MSGDVALRRVSCSRSKYFLDAVLLNILHPDRSVSRCCMGPALTRVYSLVRTERFDLPVPRRDAMVAVAKYMYHASSSTSSSVSKCEMGEQI